MDKQDTKRSRWPYWREESGIPGRKHCLEKEISRRPKLLTNIKDEVAGMRFCVTNIFVDNDILLFRFGLHNRSQIGYTIDFIRFYIQDDKKTERPPSSSWSSSLSSLSTVRRKWLRFLM